ncbi:MAG: Gfo/Idh/MocA family oxidoreductase [Sedimentisphaerales bacterium]|nr:Gfo/Idh/MocA family oxidoreductase [Sedimentisphaerales bacterium]
MSSLTRRDFIKSSVAAGAGLALAAPFLRAQGANDDIRVAVVGVGGQGGGHMNYFSRCQGARLVAICDADKSHLERRAREFEERNEGVKLKTYVDVRDLLEDKEIDAITSATPNHWHSLVTIWACQAGKDVYIEKPVSHNVWEGRKMVEAARKYSRIVQTGTQRRSSEAYIGAYDYINEGHIGAIKWVRGFCYKPRFSGNGIVNGTNGPNPLPETIDYNLWCGPADMEPLRREELHYKWHWVWNTGCGDLGNQGIHEMDESRWALGDPKLAPRVISIGGRFGVHDAGETANTQIVYLDYKPAPLIFEVRGLPRKKGDRSMDNYRGTRIGVVVQCESGYFAAGEGGGWIYDADGNRLQQFIGSGGNHHQNFIDAVRSRKVEELHADIEKGHLSSALCHMGNTSYRLGKTMGPDEIKSAISDYPELAASFDSMLQHLEANEIDLEAEPITLGPTLTMDPEKEVYVGEHSGLANMYLKRNYREPFVVPENV